MNILHVLRAPVGGLFRHVVDLARGQVMRGHRVGIIADSTTGGARAAEALGQLTPRLELGLSRVAMPRHLGPGDVHAIWHVARRIAQTGAEIVHGHGAKGGAYARMAFAPRGTVRAYTPHGGSLSYDQNSLTGKVYLTLERILMSRGSLYLFESAYSCEAFRARIGNPNAPVRIVHNGVGKSEFDPVAPADDATDIVFIGELRTLKGVDILLDALSLLRGRGRNVTTTIVGDGPDADRFHQQAAQLELGTSVRWFPPMHARAAFALGRLMVVPSRTESLPYVVLEAGAAGKRLIATDVGGIPEIYGPVADALIPANDAAALADAIARSLDEPAAADELATELRGQIAAAFSVDAMVDAVLAAYQHALVQGAAKYRQPLTISGGIK